MVIRRVELQQATGIDVFSQLKELQLQSSEHSDQLKAEESQRGHELAALRQELSTRVGNLEEKVDKTTQDLQMLALSFQSLTKEIEEMKKSAHSSLCPPFLSLEARS